MASPPLGPEQYQRYRRHLSLPEFGLEGQQRLLASSVLLIGAGGLGSPLGLYLAAAGVGRLGIVDDDIVDLSNLQRQILYRSADVGRAKVEVAAEQLRALNPDVEVETHPLRLDSSNALELFEHYDVIVDGTDNFPTRYLSNDACVLSGKPNVYGSIFRFEGQASVFATETGPCYRCLYPEPPPPGSAPSCAEAGVLGVLPGIIATIQATETIKLLTGIGSSLAGRLLVYDALAMEFSEFRLTRDPECPVCGDHPTLRELIDYSGFCGVPAPREAASGDGAGRIPTISAVALAAWMGQGDDVLLLDVREPEEWERARIDGARLIPLAQLASRIGELVDWKERPIVVHCHGGARSLRACELLRDRGFARVESLDGGIDAWSITVDPDVDRY